MMVVNVADITFVVFQKGSSWLGLAHLTCTTVVLRLPTLKALHTPLRLDGYATSFPSHAAMAALSCPVDGQEKLKKRLQCVRFFTVRRSRKEVGQGETNQLYQKYK